MTNNSGKSRMLVSLVIILLITNCVSLYFFLQNNRELKKTRDEKQVEYMRKELNLSDDQLNHYKQLRVYRDSMMAPMNTELRESKLKMIDLLRKPASEVADSTVQEVAREISNRQQNIEMEYYRHFRRVQAICDDSQRVKFDTLLVRMVNRTTGKQ